MYEIQLIISARARMGNQMISTPAVSSYFGIQISHMLKFKSAEDMCWWFLPGNNLLYLEDKINLRSKNRITVLFSLDINSFLTQKFPSRHDSLIFADISQFLTIYCFWTMIGSPVCKHTRSQPDILKTAKNSKCHSELLKISLVFFAIPTHDTNKEWVFSLMQTGWTKNRNIMNVESIRGLLFP